MKPVIVSTVKEKKPNKKKKKTAVEELTEEEREAVTIVFHQVGIQLRCNTIFHSYVCSSRQG